jgi:dienelactone hydrolase
MLRILATTYDRALCALLAGFVRRPSTGLPPAGPIPNSPDAVARQGPVIPQVTASESEGVWEFRVPSPVPSPWKESQEMRGLLLGPPDARAAVLVLHGACDNEYTFCRWMGSSFVSQGFRAVVPAAPCHLERAPRGTMSGAALFWSTDLVVAGLAQWLAEIHGLIGWLREQGVERVGILGYSIGSLTAALAATLWPDLDFVALLAPVGHHLHAIHRSHSASTLWPWMKNRPPAEVALLDRWAPVYRRPVVRRLLFLITLYDVLQPTALQQAWWQAWDRPPSHEYRHGHMSVLFCRQMYRDLEAFARGTG